MGKGSSLDLKNVVRHLPGGDASLRRVYASHDVPVKASTNCCLTILPVLSTSQDLGIQTLFTSSKMEELYHLQHMLYALNRTCEPYPPAHLSKLCGMPSGPEADSFFVAMSSSNSFLSLTQRLSSGTF